MEYGVLLEADIKRLFKTTPDKLFGKDKAKFKVANIKSEDGVEFKSAFIVSLVGWPVQDTMGLRKMVMRYSVASIQDQVYVHPVAQMAKDQGKICAEYLNKKFMAGFRPSVVASSSRTALKNFKELASISASERKAAREALQEVTGEPGECHSESEEDDGDNDDENASDAEDGDGCSWEMSQELQDKIKAGKKQRTSKRGESESEDAPSKRREVREDPTIQESAPSLTAAGAKKRPKSKAKAKAKADHQDETDNIDMKSVSARESKSGGMMTPQEFAQHDKEMSIVHAKYRQKTGKDAPSLTKLVVTDFLQPSDRKNLGQAVTGAACFAFH